MQKYRKQVLHSIIGCYILLILTHTGFGQGRVPVSISELSKEFQVRVYDTNYKWKEGDNEREVRVKVINGCDTSIEAYDAAFCAIETDILINAELIDRIQFVDPDSQMELIAFNPSRIAKLDDERTVLIPFSYCGAFDSDQQVSCFVIAGKKTYLTHTMFRCENNSCIITREFDENASVPPELKELILSKLKQIYQQEGFFPK